MSENNIDLTQAEWAVMECLWERSPRPSREVTEQMERTEGWSRSTTNTLLYRLEGKGAVAAEIQGRSKSYRALLRREDAALRETEDLLERVYHGSLSLMVSALTRRQKLSRKEIDELHAMLDRLEGGDGHD